MPSVVILAHNEEAVVGRCLTALLGGGAGPAERDVLVVFKGCTDRTAAVAASFGPPVRVVETPVASKPAALNAGDETASGFPRFYVDADVELSGDALREVAAVLEGGKVLAAAPRLEVATDGRPWSVRAYYSVWTQLPYVSREMIGSGVYGLSEQGHRRFHRFPDVVADDLFVRDLFEPGERVSVTTSFFTVHPPRRFTALVRIKSRSRAGDLELRRRRDPSVPSSGPGRRHSLVALARRPRMWPSLAVFGLVSAASWTRAVWKLRFMGSSVWERDDTARPGLPDAAGKGRPPAAS